MKKPYLNQEQRSHIIQDTYYGSHLKLNLAWEIFKRSVRQENNCITAALIIRRIGKIKLN